MPRYLVPLVRESTEYEWAEVVVDAPNEKDALERAISLAEDEEPDDESNVISWNDHGSGHGGSEISLTPGEKIELIEGEAPEPDPPPATPVRFELTKKERVELARFLQHKCRDGGIPGDLQYTFGNGGGIGISTKVRCRCGEEADITDYSAW